MLFLAATDRGFYRKPAPNMLEFYIKNYGTIDKSQSTYCGDAAGRPASKTAKKDFSADDLKFAWNTGLKF